MPRRSAFSFEILDIHLQPSMRRAFAVPTPHETFELSLRERLEALRRLVDQEVDVRTTAAA